MANKFKIFLLIFILFFHSILVLYFGNKLLFQPLLGTALPSLKEEISREILFLDKRIENLEKMIDKMANLNSSPSEVAGEVFEKKFPEQDTSKIEIKKESIEKNCQNFSQVPKREVIFSEICWMGDEDSPANEWIELKNLTQKEIDLSGWQLFNQSQKLKIVFEGETIGPQNFLVLKRGDDFSGAIKNSNEALFLFDQNCNLQDKIEATPNWPAGDQKTKQTMERKEDFSWQTSENAGGTPGKENSKSFSKEKESSDNKETKKEPTISLSFPPQIFSKQEFEVFLFVSGLKSTSYDVKISILKNSEDSEEKRTISEISLDGKEWQNSYKYLINVFSGSSFSGKFKLKIPIDFVGDAEILAKIRESETKNLSANFFQKIKIESYFDQSFVPKEESVKIESKSSLKILINEIQIDSLEGPGGTDDDWVELYNPNNETIFLTGWSIQKHSKSDPCSIETGFYKKNFPDDAQIPPKGFFLIVSTKANENLKNISDMTIGWSLTKDNTIYLVKKQDKILGKEDPDIVDRVGFGNACWPEKNPAPDPEEGKTIERINFQDTDDNSIDFQIQSNPSPKNSKSL